MLVEPKDICERRVCPSTRTTIRSAVPPSLNSKASYYRARYYNAALQRFISEDPLGYAGGSVNFYGYAHNNPVSFIDPFGLSACDAACQGVINRLKALFPCSVETPDEPKLLIPQDYHTVHQTLEDAGYQEPPMVGLVGPWNPFLYFDPIYHAGGDEFRVGVDNASIHFREKYPGPLIPQSDDWDPFHTQPGLGGRKTILDQFHKDNYDPRRDPRGHTAYELLGLPDGSLDWGPFVTTF